MDGNRERMRELVRAIDVRPVRGYVVQVRFDSGTVRDIDLLPYLRGPVFDVIRDDPAIFGSVTVVSGALTWPNGADIDPDVLYYGVEPVWATEEREPQG